jgi:hypothetical protein
MCGNCLTSPQLGTERGSPSQRICSIAIAAAPAEGSSSSAGPAATAHSPVAQAAAVSRLAFPVCPALASASAASAHPASIANVWSCRNESVSGGSILRCRDYRCFNGNDRELNTHKQVSGSSNY